MQLRSWCVWAFAAATACGGSSRGAGASSTDAGGDGSSGSASSSGPSGSSGSNGGSFSGASTSSGSSNGSSGGPSSSGTSGASTGSSSGGSGGASSSGTSSSGSGDGGSTTHLTPQQMVQAMMPGWNLGNTFDAQPNETSWGNPEPTQAMIQAVHAAGFNTMRIPVTWTDHIGSAPAYTIDSAWMAKVQQVATWADQAGMYAIVNTHHDADLEWVLLTDP